MVLILDGNPDLSIVLILDGNPQHGPYIRW